jgi:hypothetical protein
MSSRSHSRPGPAHQPLPKSTLHAHHDPACRRCWHFCATPLARGPPAAHDRTPSPRAPRSLGQDLLLPRLFPSRHAAPPFSPLCFGSKKPPKRVAPTRLAGEHCRIWVFSVFHTALAPHPFTSCAGAKLSSTVHW